MKENHLKKIYIIIIKRFNCYFSISYILNAWDTEAQLENNLKRTMTQCKLPHRMTPTPVNRRLWRELHVRVVPLATYKKVFNYEHSKFDLKIDHFVIFFIKKWWEADQVFSKPVSNQ